MWPITVQRRVLMVSIGGYHGLVARQASIVVVALSLVAAVGIFACIWSGHGGYLQ